MDRATTVTATGDITVAAANVTEVVSVAASLSVATDGFAGSGSASSINLDHNVEAFVAAGAVVSADGSIYVDADERANVTIVGGSAAGSSGDAGVGLSLANLNLSRTVQAYVGEGATVTAKGNGSGILDPGGTGCGGAGLTLDATTEDHLLLFAGGGAVSESFALAGSAVVNTMHSTTMAYIAAGALVNQDGNSGAVTAQGVRLRANQDTFILDIAGSLGVGTDGVGIGAGLDLGLINKNTIAYIGRGAQVAAKGEVSVTATSTEDLLSVSATAGIGGNTGGIAGSASIQIFTTITRAYVEDAPLDGDGATINAGGNVLINATGTFTGKLIAGSVGVGSSVGIGASNATLDHTDTVEAYVGDFARH